MNEPVKKAKTIEDLRDHLFDTIVGLRDGTVSVEKATIIADLGQVIVNSAKVEADVMRATRHKGSGFIPEAPALPTAPGTPRLVDKSMGNR